MSFFFGLNKVRRFIGLVFKSNKSRLYLEDADEIVKDRFFSRRAFIVTSAQGIVGLSVVLRLINLQIFSHKKYSILSERNQYHPEFIIPLRGLILGRNGEKLADNRVYYKAVLLKFKASDLLAIAKDFVPLLDSDSTISPDLIARIWIAEAKKNPRDNLILRRFLSKDEVARILYHKNKLPFVVVEEDSQRLYNLGSAAAHVVGHLGVLSKKAIDENPFTLKRLAAKEYKLGHSGIEKAFDKRLTGKMGVYVRREDSTGKVLGGLAHTDPIHGEDLKTTIDAHLQIKANELLAGKNGSIVLLSAKTGEILVMASSPSFDPNNISRGIKGNAWNVLSATKNVFINKATSNLYSPGSCFKIASCLAALRAGVNPKEKYTCRGSIRMGNRIFHCLKEDGHGPVNMTEAIIRSCNCYLFNFAKTANVNQIAEAAFDLGLGKEFLDLGLPNRSGIVPTKSWKARRIKEPWMQGETLNTIIGQGYTEVSPLQLAVMSARVATGIPINPILTPESSAFVREKQFNAKDLEYIAHIKEAMLGVFEDSVNGTCRWFKPSSPNERLAGKTGSAQVVSKRIKQSLLLSGVVPEEIRPHGLFVGFGPYEDPKFAVAVAIEHGISGTRTAPIGRDLLLEAMRQKPIQDK